MPKSMTLRLSDEQATELEVLAQIEGKPVAVVIRDAITHYGAARRNDEDFQERLRERLEQTRAALEGFQKPAG